MELSVVWTGKVIAYANAVAESFSRMIKTELENFKKFKTRVETNKNIFEYIVIYCIEKDGIRHLIVFRRLNLKKEKLI